MVTYSLADLKNLDHDRPPARRVRKKLFTLPLWRPARHRRRPAYVRRPVAAASTASNVNNATRRSADRSMLVEWLNVQSLMNNTDAVSELIVDRSLDVLVLTETWHSASDDARLHLATPTGYAVVDVARSTGRGGGVAVIFRKHLRSFRLHWSLFTVGGCSRGHLRSVLY